METLLSSEYVLAVKPYLYQRTKLIQWHSLVAYGQPRRSYCVKGYMLEEGKLAAHETTKGFQKGPL